MFTKWLVAGAAAPLMTFMAMADDQADSIPFQPVEAQIDSEAIPLYEGAAPGSEGVELEEIWRNAGTERWITNITVPTLLPVLPEDPSETRAAVIVIPGGGFQFVSIDNEGYPIADWLADRGVAAFVLKYRTMETPSNTAEFAEYMRIMWAPEPGDPQIDVMQGVPFAVADAQAALSMVRENAEEWGFDADKVGMLGFSAGAMTTLGVTLAAEEDAPKPDYIGYIYGPMLAVDAPENAPPMFNALAADDPLFQGQGFGIIESWEAVGAPVEFHYYQSGGHGFGSYKRGVPADDWFDQYMRWMTALGLLAPSSDED